VSLPTNDIKFNVANGLAVGASGFEVINTAGEWVGASGPGQSPYGATGADGTYGASGPTGEQGTTGQQGSQGLDGATGFTGITYYSPDFMEWIGASFTVSQYAQLEFVSDTHPIYVALRAASVGDVIEINFQNQFVGVATIVDNSAGIEPFHHYFAIAVSLSPNNNPGNTLNSYDLFSYIKFLSAVGYQGATGADGYQGTDGEQGYTGVTGADGVQGATGFVGIDGASGAQGEQGVTGQQGATGGFGGYRTGTLSFDPNYTNFDLIELYNGNNSAQDTNEGFANALGTIRLDNTSGNYYYMFSIHVDAVNDNGSFIGIANHSADINNSNYFLGSDTNSAGFAFNGEYWYNGGVQSGSLPTWGQGDVVDIAVDQDDNWLWIRVNGGDWNNDPTANPGNYTGGLSTYALSGPWYPAVSIYGVTGTTQLTIR